MQVFHRIFKKKTQNYPLLEAAYNHLENDINSSYTQKDEAEDSEDEEDREYSNELKQSSIEEVFGDEISQYSIFRDDEIQCFYVTYNLRAIYDMVGKNSAKSIHEVTLPGTSQKLKYDIDMPADDICEIHNEHDFDNHEEVDPVTKAGYEEFRKRYIYTSEEQIERGDNTQFKDPNYSWAYVRAEFCVWQLLKAISVCLPGVPIVVCTSHGTKKFSYHIIVCAYAEGYEDAHQHAIAIWNKIGASYVKRFIDLAVYKSVQNFRIAGAYKYVRENNEMVRRKIIRGNPSGLSEFENWCMSLISYIDEFSVRLPSVTKTAIKSFSQNEEYKDISMLPAGFEAIMKPYSEGLVTDQVNGNLVHFQRVNPSLCKICNRIHENDNSLYTMIHKDCYILKCRRNSHGRSIIIPISSHRQNQKSRRIDKLLSE